MRILDIITEASALDYGKLTKRAGRVEKFIELINAKHTFQSNIGPVQIDPTGVPKILQDIKIGNSRMTVPIVGGNPVPIGTIHYDDAIFSADKTGRNASKAGDTSIKLKPADTFNHGTPEKDVEVTPELAIQLGGFNSGQLAQKIVANSHLQSQGRAGEAVIQMAKELNAGRAPLIPNDLNKKQITTIQNDAFEYLGVLALIKGVAVFPNSEDFYNHLGTNLENTTMLFPNTTNNPVADSYALTNAEGNTIFISSKGKQGAPQSISAVKIPENLLKSKDPAIQFLQLIQGKGQWRKPFDAANWIATNFPGTLGDLEKFLPFDETFLKYLEDTKKLGKNVPNKVSQIPAQYRALFSQIAKANKENQFPLFLYIRNYVKSFVFQAVNSQKAVPTFTTRMLEVLGQNFIVLKTKPINGQFVTYVQWPNKMSGQVIFKEKDPADKWGSAMTWRLI